MAAVRARPWWSVTSFPWFAVALGLGTACAHPSTPVAPKPGYGSVMAEVGRRYELLGKALAAGRTELARYELGELEEAFTEALPHASPPKEGTPSVLPALETSFARDQLPTLARALSADGGVDAAPAFARAAAACNECHQASGHNFIEVPAVPGQGVPELSPVSGSTPR